MSFDGDTRRGSSRVGRFQIPRHYLVDRGKVPQVRQGDVDFYRIVQGSAGSVCHCRQIPEHLGCLGRDIALYYLHCVWNEGYLTR